MKHFALTILLLVCFSGLQAQEADYIVGLKQDAPRKGKVKKELPFIKAYVTRLSKAAALELRKDKRVKYVEENRPMQLNEVQTGALWNLARIDQRGPLGTPPDTDYNYTATGEGVIAYIIDTGVMLEHPEFEGRAIAGYGDNADVATCGNGHGTHVAGTVGSKTYGVAKKATLVSVRIATCTEPLSVASLIYGLEWIAVQKSPRKETRVANISITGAGSSPAVDAAIDAVREKKVVVVVAAGNSAGDACWYFPAGYAPVLTVGASWQEDKRSLSSNFGTCVDLFAPGFEVTSTWNNGSSNVLSGTSMASPHVVGAAALYLQNHKRASVLEVETAVLSNATAGALADVGEGSPNLLIYSLF